MPVPSASTGRPGGSSWPEVGSSPTPGDPWGESRPALTSSAGVGPSEGGMEPYKGPVSITFVTDEGGGQQNVPLLFHQESSQHLGSAVSYPRN